MDKNRNILAVVTTFLVLFVSCNVVDRDQDLKENQVEFDTLVVENRQYLRNDTVSPFCDLNIHFVYPDMSLNFDLSTLQQLFISNTFGLSYIDIAPEEAIEMYTTNFFNSYEADARVFRKEFSDLEGSADDISQSFSSQHEKELHPQEFYTYIETLSTKIYFNKNNLLSFQVRRTNKKGSSATYSSYNNYVVNLETGKLVTENDLFIAGYDVELQRLFESKLLQENSVNTVYDLEELGYFGIEEIMPNRNFLIDEKGITYIFNKGEYSAYLLDAQEVFIPFKDVAMLLRENTLVSKLAEL